MCVALILYPKNFHGHVTSRVNIANNTMLLIIETKFYKSSLHLRDYLKNVIK